MHAKRRFAIRVMGASLTIATACGSSPAVSIDSGVSDAVHASDASHLLDAAHALDAAPAADGAIPLADAGTTIDTAPPADAAPLAASLSPLPSQLQFHAISNGGQASLTQAVTLIDVGTADASNLQFSIIGPNEFDFSLVSGSSCFGNITLNPTDKCGVLIQFGPSAVHEAVGARNASLVMSYNLDAAGDSTLLTIPLLGSIAQAQPAVITSAIVDAEGFAAGDGSSDAPLAIEDDDSVATITVEYTNNGAGTADGFSVENPTEPPWSVASSNCNGVTLVADGGFCTVVYQLKNWPGDGEFDLELLDSATASWTDDTGAHAGQSIGGVDTVAAVVFAAPIITITTNLDANGDVAQNGSFSVTITLSGGINVGDQTFEFEEVSPISNNFTLEGEPCSVNSGSPSCTDTFDVDDSNVGDYFIEYGLAGNVPISGSTDLLVTVNPPPKYIFVSFASFNGNLGGFSGANTKCNDDIGTAASSTPYFALLEGNNATTAGVSYFNAENGQFVATATGGDFAPTLINALGSSGDVFTGAHGNSCNNWTSSVHAGSPIADAGNAGATDGSWFFNHTIFCDASARLICVQQ